MDELSEQQKFLADLEPENKDPFEKPLEEVDPPAQGEDTPEEAEMKLKNRRERRLNEKLQSEREANIALNARLQGITESQSMRKDTEEADYLKRAERIYGNATPEAKEATELLKEALEGVKQSARKEALAEFEKSRNSESEAQKEQERKLDSILEDVEDKHKIDMSGEDRKGFLTLLERVSPKDKDGDIIEYADPDTVAELYLSRKEKPSSRAKDLASRSMVRGGQSQPSQLMDDASVRYLKDNGII